MKTVRKLILLSLLVFSNSAISAGHYLSGEITDISSVAAGLLIMLSSGTPDNCASTPYNWMLIKEENKTMVSVALTMWATKNMAVTVYTDSFAPGSGYCVINQLDPT